MIAAIADTHTVIWYLFSDERLGRAASAFIESTIANGDHIGVSAISFAEMVYLVEKDRIQATALDDLLLATTDPDSVLPRDSGSPRPHHCRHRPSSRRARLKPRWTHTGVDRPNNLVIS
jgi:hypothetical protein